MSIAKFEHVNVTVSDPKKTASMLTRLFGWKVRWEGPSKYDGYTVHVGTDEDYLALYALPQQERPDEESYYRTGTVNHFGILVDDLDAGNHRGVCGERPFRKRQSGRVGQLQERHIARSRFNK